MDAAVTRMICPEMLHSASSVRCSASDVLRWPGMHALSTRETDEMLFPLRRVHAESTLIHEGQPFETLYLVGAGSFKSVQSDVDGYEQVLGFSIHGDTIGLDGLHRGQHVCSAVALEDSTVALLPFRDWVAVGHGLPAMERLLHHAIGAELQHRSETQYLMSAASSEVRLARFLLHFAQRQFALGHSERRLRLRMTRRDIASCLALAHETVSRALTALANDGCITVSHRDIEIVDADALHEMQRLTRGTCRARTAHGGDEMVA